MFQWSSQGLTIYILLPAYITVLKNVRLNKYQFENHFALYSFIKYAWILSVFLKPESIGNSYKKSFNTTSFISYS